ncbi:MAG: type VI secretion system baseplate subunit TssK [Gemmatimonadota bacterium]
MKPLARVVWSEGMHLTQHHFQAQNRYFEESLDFALARVGFEPYGLLGLELDAEALRNGTASVIHARGVMPDGLAFQIPEGDPPPPPVDIREAFLPTQDRQVLCLTLPPYREDRANCVQDGEDGHGFRFTAETVSALDETTGRDEKPVVVGRKNFGLALATEVEEGVEALPLAQIRRDGSGQFVYDDQYVPPTLHIGASPRLVDLLQRLVQILEAKNEVFASEPARAESSVAEYGPQEIVGFWLRHAIRQSLAPLRHHLSSRRSHPEQLYTELARLAGALCTFSLGSEVGDVPRYDHRNLTETFNGLERHIRRHLEITLPTSCVTIPLERHEKYIFLHSAAVEDARCWAREAQWILGVRAQAGAAALIRDVRTLVKFASKTDIAALVKEGTAGLPLEHLPSPPSVISPRIGSEYFRIGGSRALWKGIRESGKIGVYVPEALPGAELEVIVVLEA